MSNGRMKMLLLVCFKELMVSIFCVHILLYYEWSTHPGICESKSIFLFRSFVWTPIAYNLHANDLSFEPQFVMLYAHVICFADPFMATWFKRHDSITTNPCCSNWYQSVFFVHTTFNNNNVQWSPTRQQPSPKPMYQQQQLPPPTQH